MIIYKATNLINNKIYIGQTINTLEYRMSQHIRDAANPNRKTVYFHNALRKYGAENFKFEIIDTANTQDELNEKERYWIAYYKSNQREFGYNEDSGGKSGGVKSDITKRKIGDTTLRKWEDEDTASKMLAGLRKGTESWRQICYNKRVLFICPYCGAEMLLPKNIAESKSACSKECKQKHGGFADVAKRASQIASVVNSQRAANRRAEIKEFIVDWCNKNKSDVLNCKYNAIDRGLSRLVETINKIYGIKDLRSIAACFGLKYKKELLSELKNIVS